MLARGTGGGTGLQVMGPAVFSRSGKATARAGATKVTVTGIPITHQSLVLALAQEAAGVFVRSAVPNPFNRRFTINLNEAPQVNVAVAWFVVN